VNNSDELREENKQRREILIKSSISGMKRRSHITTIADVIWSKGLLNYEAVTGFLFQFH